MSKYLTRVLFASSLVGMCIHFKSCMLLVADISLARIFAFKLEQGLARAEANDDPLSQWFAIPAFFIIFRETLEATVIGHGV